MLVLWPASAIMLFLMFAVGPSEPLIVKLVAFNGLRAFSVRVISGTLDKTWYVSCSQEQNIKGIEEGEGKTQNSPNT